MPKSSGETLKRAVQLAALKAGEYPPGTQIMYVPSHTEPYSKFCAYGFIFSYNEMYVFCRFFNDNNFSSVKGYEDLRTVANSEACNPEDLNLHISRPQEIVDACVKKIQEDFDKGRTGR
ncbi:hypothetical protein KAR91_37570 [Candidatus Pacearchaeota archaeon]|nr:hypothetical protein [Candidatus Pacearchaeota archaeon]